MITMKHLKSVELAASIAAALLLAGCGRAGMDDLHNYVAQVKSRPGSGIDPLPEPKPYEAFVYQAFALRNPFSAETPGEPGEREETSGMVSDNGVRPDFDRPREPTESFPLDGLRLVGSVEMEGRLWGLIQSLDGTIHRVLPGNYLGQNYGRISLVTEERVDLTEIVPDGLGGWMERQASLVLSDE